MPETQEVFQMATQKVGPDRGFLERQNRRQRRRARNRKVGPLVFVAAIVAGFATFVLTHPAGTTNVPITSVSPSVTLPKILQEGIHLSYLDVRTGTITPGPFIAGGNEYSVTPDGTMIAYVGPAPSAGAGEMIFVADIDGTTVSNVRPLERTTSTRATEIFDLGLSRDGSRIVYQLKPSSSDRFQGDLYVVDADTGTTAQITDLPPLPTEIWAMAPTFSPDGATVMFDAPSRSERTDSLTSNLYSVPADGGKPTIVRRGAILGTYSPDGTKIAFSNARFASVPDLGPGGIFVADVDGTNARHLVKGAVGWSRSWSPDGTRIAYEEPDGSTLHILDLRSGETSTIAGAGVGTWVGDHMMIFDNS